jgi:membrane associated rhomboid family serine protease
LDFGLIFQQSKIQNRQSKIEMSLDYQKEPQTEETEEKEEQLVRATPVTPYYSYVLVICIIIVSIFQIGLDTNYYIESTNDSLRNLILFGGYRSGLIAGFYKQAFINGEYWRVLTGAALHGGIIHLAFNSYALYILGKLVETLSNRAHLAIVFLLSAIGGNLLSLAFMPDGVSVGASGGIIGFLGYLTIYGFYRRKIMSNALLKNMLFNVVFIGFVGVFVIKNVDNYAHLGGLLTGAVYGLFQIPRDLYKDPREASETTTIIGYAALGIFIFVSVLTILLLFQIVRM